MTDCLTCPEPQNYAAVALQLQNTAMQAETCLFELQKQLRNGTNPSTTIFTTTGTQSIVPNALVDLNPGALTPTFNSTPVTALTGLGPNLDPGVYQVGICLTATASGVVDDNSLRIVRIRTKRDGTPSGAPNDASAEESVYEPNNGNGVDMSLMATMTLDGSQDLIFSFFHLNVSSNITIATGCTFWWSKLSDQVALRAV